MLGHHWPASKTPYVVSLAGQLFTKTKKVTVGPPLNNLGRFYTKLFEIGPEVFDKKISQASSFGKPEYCMGINSF